MCVMHICPALSTTVTSASISIKYRAVSLRSINNKNHNKPNKNSDCKMILTKKNSPNFYHSSATKTIKVYEASYTRQKCVLASNNNFSKLVSRDNLEPVYMSQSSGFFSFADLCENKGFSLAENPFFCLSQQKIKRSKITA